MSFRQTTLGELCTFITDGKHGDCKDQPESGYFFLSAKDVRDGKLNYGTARQITKIDFLDTDRRTRLEANDLVISNSGTIGRMALVKSQAETRRTTFQKSVAILKPKHDMVISVWLYYYLLANINRLVSFAGGTAQKNLLLRDLRSFSINLQPLQLQRKVASVLSAYDDLIENNTRRIAILESMAQALYQEWFVRFRFPGHENVPLVDSPIGKVPQGWQTKQLGDLIELAYGKALKADNRTAGSIPVYGSGGIAGFHNKPLVSGPGIILGRKGNVGSVYWSNEDFFPIDTVFYIVTSISKFYAYYSLLMSQTFLNSDAAVPGLNRSQAYRNPFVLPTDELLRKFDEQVSAIFSIQRNLRKKNEVLYATRDLLLPKLISGQIDVEHLDIDLGETQPAIEDATP